MWKMLKTMQICTSCIKIIEEGQINYIAVTYTVTANGVVLAYPFAHFALKTEPHLSIANTILIA